MKKKILFSILIGILMFGMSCTKPNNPENVFFGWQKAAISHNYDKMFKYEIFKDLDNVIFSYETIIKGKWSVISEQQKQDFIDTYYKPALKTALEQLSEEKYIAFFRLDPKLNLKIDSYEVKGNDVKMWLTGDFSGDEMIKMSLSDNKWKLYNPLGYHSYLPTRMYIKKHLGLSAENPTKIAPTSEEKADDASDNQDTKGE